MKGLAGPVEHLLVVRLVEELDGRAAAGLGLELGGADAQQGDGLEPVAVDPPREGAGAVVLLDQAGGGVLAATVDGRGDCLRGEPRQARGPSRAVSPKPDDQTTGTAGCPGSGRKNSTAGWCGNMGERARVGPESLIPGEERIP